jgi:hypothetical protein
MPAQLVQDVHERIYRTFRDRCSDLNIDLGKAVADELDMWLEHSNYEEAFIERQRKILQEGEFVSLDEIIQTFHPHQLWYANLRRLTTTIY